MLPTYALQRSNQLCQSLVQQEMLEYVSLKLEGEGFKTSKGQNQTDAASVLSVCLGTQLPRPRPTSLHRVTTTAISPRHHHDRRDSTKPL